MGPIEFILLLIFLISLYYSIRYYYKKNKKEKCSIIYIPQSIEEEEETIQVDNIQFNKVIEEEVIDSKSPTELLYSSPPISIPTYTPPRETQSLKI